MKLAFSARRRSLPPGSARLRAGQPARPTSRRKVELGLRLEREDYVAWFGKLDAARLDHARLAGRARRPGLDASCSATSSTRKRCSAARRASSPAASRCSGPVLIRFGTEEQKAQYLPDIRQQRDLVGAGLLRAGRRLGSCRRADHGGARATASDFIVNGHKVWTSYAQWCSMMFALVRTDPKAAKPQEGISFLLIDMASPGRRRCARSGCSKAAPTSTRSTSTTCACRRPTWSASCTRAGPAANTCSATSAPASPASARASSSWRGYATLAAQQRPRRRPGAAPRLAQFEAELMALEFTGLRLLSANQQSRVPASGSLDAQGAGHRAAPGHLRMLLDVAGPHAVPFDEGARPGRRREALPVRRAWRRWRPTTSTRASCRSTAAPTKCSAT